MHQISITGTSIRLHVFDGPLMAVVLISRLLSSVTGILPVPLVAVTVFLWIILPNIKTRPWKV